GFTCARSSTGLVKCWGYNGRGALGLGDSLDRGDGPATVPSRLSALDLGTGRKAISISAGGGSTCALLDNGDLKCWGNHAYGQLGTGDTNDLGDLPGEMGDALKPVPLGAKRAIGVSVGAAHTCVILDGGSVECWGSNDYGQLGQNHRKEILSPKDLAPVKLARPVAIAVSASSFLDAGKGGDFGNSSCALLDNGSVQCWGETKFVPHSDSTDIDSSGAIGDYTGEMNGVPVLTFGSGRQAKSLVAGSVSGAILDDGSLKLWGMGSQLGQPDLAPNPVGLMPGELASLPAVRVGSGKKVKSISVSRHYACAVLDDKSVKCWGQGWSGELGLGDTFSTDGAPENVPPVSLGGVGAQQVATGYNHTCAILVDGTMKCWGNNSSGQLGLGDSINRGDTGTSLSADTTVDLAF
ncbi:MAG TPA: hypothetical protein VER12_17475, partial [Polyangiaceae bacterium]|nr:hypothetical protein [Polyangiaceae bacterium]